MRILAAMEALSLTGPAKNLLQFGRLARELRGVELILVNYRRATHPATDDFIEKARELGLTLEILPDGGAWDLSLAGQLKALCEKWRPDVVQTHNVKSHFLFRLSGMVSTRPWVAWNHGYTWPTFRQRVYNHFDYVSLRAATKVVTVTGSFVPGLLKMGVRRERIAVIGNAIDVNDFARTGGELERERYATAGQRIVLAVGRLSKEKGHELLLQAVRRLNERGGEHVVLLVGDGPERENLSRAARQLGVKLTLAGQCSDVKPYYALADVFALPSYTEGSPNVLLEAMAACLPIVSTKAGGITETVKDGQEALLVETGNGEAMSRALEQMARDEASAREMAVRARQRVSAERSPQRRTEQILDLYSQLLAE